MSLARRIRGVIGTAVLWGASFAAVSPVIIIAEVALGMMPRKFVDGMLFLRGMEQTFFVGAVAGTLFALLMIAWERRKTLEALSTRRAVVWGILSTVALPAMIYASLGVLSRVPMFDFIMATLECAVLGGVMSAGTLRLARRAPQLVAGDDTAVPALAPGR